MDLTPQSRVSSRQRRPNVLSLLQKIKLLPSLTLRSQSLLETGDGSLPLSHLLNVFSVIPMVCDVHKGGGQDVLAGLTNEELGMIESEYGIGSRRSDGTLNLTLPRAAWSSTQEQKQRWAHVFSTYTSIIGTRQTADDILSRTGSVEARYSSSKREEDYLGGPSSQRKASLVEFGEERSAISQEERGTHCTLSAAIQTPQVVYPSQFAGPATLISSRNASSSTPTGLSSTAGPASNVNDIGNICDVFGSIVQPIKDTAFNSGNMRDRSSLAASNPVAKLEADQGSSSDPFVIVMSRLSISPNPTSPSHHVSVNNDNNPDHLESGRNLVADSPRVFSMQFLDADYGGVGHTSGALDRPFFQVQEDSVSSRNDANVPELARKQIELEYETSQTPLSPVSSLSPKSLSSPDRHRRALAIPQTTRASGIHAPSEVRLGEGCTEDSQGHEDADMNRPLRLECEGCMSRELQCDYDWYQTTHKACTTCSRRNVKCVIEELERVLRMRSILLHRGMTLLESVLQSRQKALDEVDEKGILVLNRLYAFYALNQLIPFESLKTSDDEEEYTLFPGEGELRSKLEAVSGLGGRRYELEQLKEDWRSGYDMAHQYLKRGSLSTESLLREMRKKVSWKLCP